MSVNKSFAVDTIVLWVNSCLSENFPQNEFRQSFATNLLPALNKMLFPIQKNTCKKLICI